MREGTHGEREGVNGGGGGGVFVSGVAIAPKHIDTHDSLKLKMIVAEPIVWLTVPTP